MGTSKNRVRVGSLLLAAATATTGTIALAGPAEAAAPDPIPPMDCGMVHHESGALSATIHALEPSLLPLGLAFFVHDFNCNYVINTEYLLGLQQRPGPPF